MNYLAHARLSFGHPQILVGNMISDFIKGRARYDYPPEIQKGIVLHREIDRFTDEHEATREAKNIFRPAYRLYSGPLVDIIYDHFLATSEDEFPLGQLEAFSKEVYTIVEEFSQHLPSGFQHMFTYMRLDNWLLNYGKYEGIRWSLRGLVHRAAYVHESETAYSLFLSEYDALKICFENFFPDVKRFAKQKFEELVS